jgi:transposase-like protein
VASIALGWAEFKSYLAEIGPERGRPERPSECPFCDGGRVWFDGWRWVFCAVLEDGAVHRFDDGLPLQRVVCASCGVSWTLRPAFLYPHRSFEPDVVEHAGLAYLTDPAATYSRTAREHGCSPRSVWRWVGWLGRVVQARVLLAEAERLSGAGQSAALIPREVPQDHVKARSAARAATLLATFQVLCALVVWSRAQPAPSPDPSPLRSWLVERFLAFRELHGLTTVPSSPRSPEDSTGPPRIHRRA